MSGPGSAGGAAAAAGGIRGEDLASRLAGLEGIGETPEGIVRLAWTPEDAACRAWFAEQAAELGRATETDPAGNLWAPPPGVAPPWWGAGSHLDSVRGGGRYDGPLGVAAAFEVAARASAPVAVLCLADEEGARYNTPTFGSRALVGRLDAEEVVARTDDRGIALGDALAAAGVDPDGLAEAPAWLERLRGFLELHIDQTRELAIADRPTGVVSGLASRLRVQADIVGRADHAGTTSREERRDALSAAARLIVAGEEKAPPEMVVTAARMLVEPNALTTIAGHVRLWLDARAAEVGEVDGWLDAVRAEAAAIASRTRTEVALQVASRSAGTPFDPRVRAALGGGPELLSFAGHDAGVLAERIPAGMVFVRNPTGISHSPEEAVDLGDAALGANALLRALEELAA